MIQMPFFLKKKNITKQQDTAQEQSPSLEVTGSTWWVFLFLRGFFFSFLLWWRVRPASIRSEIQYVIHLE
jgi:hypothetical protein